MTTISGPSIKIGTCSWKYDSWVGLVYSDKKDKPDYLRQYAANYDTVEVDQWFWSLFENHGPKMPDPKVVQDYLEAVPENFSFSVKIPNSITLTHFYTQGKDAPLKSNPYFLSGEVFRDFLDRISPLKNRLGPLMFQFEYLNKKKMASQAEFLEKFAAFIASCPREFDYALEIRNPNYLNANYFRFLQEHRLHHVFAHGYYMPPITEIYYKNREYIHELAVVRLLGADRQGIEAQSGKSWGRIVAPKDGELADIVAMVRDMADRGIRIYLNINNHYEGSAPLTIQKIREMLVENL